VRKTLLLTAVILAAVVFFLAATLPPAPARTTGAADQDLQQRTIAGAYHVHSTVSDGAADRRTIAAAASRAGLQFVVFSDHGDGTRVPAPPQYVDGVLSIDGVEISTDHGHYVAIDMRPAPYPLGGAAAAVVEDVRRLGGFGIAAHPDSPKESLRWSDWSAPIDGIEWLNADSEWRDEPKMALLRAPFDYLVRPGPALAATLDRPSQTMARWDTMSAARPVVALAAHDAHGGFGHGDDEGDKRLLALPVPSYEASFRAFSIRTVLTQPLSGEARGDARLVVDAIRRGRAFSVIDAVASPAWLDFRAANGTTSATMGDVLPHEPGLRFTVRGPVTVGARLVLVCNGREVAEASGGRLDRGAEGPAACRVEGRLASAPGNPPVPWIVSNPIHLLPAVGEPIGSEPLYETVPLTDANWVVESDPGSRARLSPEAIGFQLDYTLRPGERASQYVAAVTRFPATQPGYDRIIFSAESMAPMRISVQLRLEGGEERWGRSVYVSPDARRLSVPLAEFLPVGPSTQPLDARRVVSLLFVVDLTNARPGASGRVRITDVAFARQIF
jgi:hypothetical protein